MFDDYEGDELHAPYTIDEVFGSNRVCYFNTDASIPDSTTSVTVEFGDDATYYVGMPIVLKPDIYQFDVITAQFNATLYDTPSLNLYPDDWMTLPMLNIEVDVVIPGVTKQVTDSYHPVNCATGIRFQFSTLDGWCGATSVNIRMVSASVDAFVDNMDPIDDFNWLMEQ